MHSANTHLVVPSRTWNEPPFCHTSVGLLFDSVVGCTNLVFAFPNWTGAIRRVLSAPGGQVIAEEFRSQEIDGQSLLLLTEDHLVGTMRLKLGPALKLCAHINSLKDPWRVHIPAVKEWICTRTRCPRFCSASCSDSRDVSSWDHCHGFPCWRLQLSERSRLIDEQRWALLCRLLYMIAHKGLLSRVLLFRLFDTPITNNGNYLYLWNVKNLY